MCIPTKHLYSATAVTIVGSVAGVIFLAALPVPASVSSSSGTTSAQAYVEAERGIVRCANRNRIRRGLAPLIVEASLGSAARLHSRNMLRHGFFDHTDPWAMGPGDRVALFDASPWAIGENISAGYTSSSSACRGWMASSGHRDNILDPGYTHIGAGFARGPRGYGYHYTQVFSVLYEDGGS